MDCNLCSSYAWKGPDCKDCPLYQKRHYSEGMGTKKGDTADLFCVAESPTITHVSPNTDQHISWSSDIEKTIISILTNTSKAFIEAHKLYSRIYR